MLVQSTVLTHQKNIKVTTSSLVIATAIVYGKHNIFKNVLFKCTICTTAYKRLSKV